jgi:hypothetical protein
MKIRTMQSDDRSVGFARADACYLLVMKGGIDRVHGIDGAIPRKSCSRRIDIRHDWWEYRGFEGKDRKSSSDYHFGRLCNMLDFGSIRERMKRC